MVYLGLELFPPVTDVPATVSFYITQNKASFVSLGLLEMAEAANSIYSYICKIPGDVSPYAYHASSAVLISLVNVWASLGTSELVFSL